MQPVGVYIDLELFSKAAHRSHLSHTRDGFQVVFQVIILIRTEFAQVQSAGVVGQGVLIDPPQGRGIRAEFRDDTGRQTRQHRGEIFLDPRPRPIDVRALCERDIDVGVAKIRDAAHGLDLGPAD